MNDSADTLWEYHQATKHHFHRYARSAGHMDWANQPTPFRSYAGAPDIQLPLPGPQTPPGAYAGLYSVCSEPPRELDRESLGSFLSLSMGLSAWKTAGRSRWPLRIHPSSGNLHPTESYLGIVAPAEMTGGIYHYQPYRHALERRAQAPEQVCEQWRRHFNGAGFWMALSSIFWRESWKYGERAFRYGHLDLGHAVAALAYAARLHGWRLTSICGAGDDQLDILLGVSKTAWPQREAETPAWLGWISIERPDKPIPRHLPDSLVRPFADLPFTGVPNRLSRQAVGWPIIEKAAAAARKPACAGPQWTAPADPPDFPPPAGPQAATVIRQRRSATRYDPQGSIASDDFFSILDRTRPRAGLPPFDAAPGDPAVDLVLFVHRVAGIDAGLYCLLRSGTPAAAWQAMCRPDFEWRRIRPGFPLWLLRKGDVRFEAMELSCHQDIAGYSAFAAAMVAPLKSAVASRPFMYRHLHWECGMIGQVLYLEAEAHGLRGTGIGCFFDDPVAELLGIADDTASPLYHFTVGHPIEDQRLQTLPPYGHLSPK